MKWSDWLPTEHATIALIVLILLCVRLVSFAYFSSLTNSNLAAYPYPIVSGDSIYYVRAADNLLNLHAYQEVPGVPLRGAPPGYPALLAATKAATGSVTPLVIVQTLFSALAVVLLYRMARTLVLAPYAAAVALLYALDPMVIFTDTTLIKDGLFSSLLICIVYLAFFRSYESIVLRWTLVGLLLGIAVLISPIGQFLVLVFPAMFIFRQWMNGGKEYNLRAIAACIVGFALIVVPWMVRNHSYFGSYEISSLGGYDLLTNDVRGYLGWRALAASSHPLPAILVMRHFDDPIFAQVDKQIASDLAKLVPPGADPESYQGQLAMRYILHDPLRYGYFHAVNTIPFFISSSIASYQQMVTQLRDNTGFYAPASLSLLSGLKGMMHPKNADAFMNAVFAIAPTVLEILFWMLVALAAGAGLFFKRNRFTVVLCAVLVLYFAALTGPMSTSRYRIPAEGYLLLLAAAGAQAIVQRTKEKLRSATS